ncbi:WD40 repeat domain-containing protein [Candidatus Poribacteria bacterium]|nr:WD40 repeat domain-containing protein [Candidatus Poribacteria bacterium]
MVKTFSFSHFLPVECYIPPDTVVCRVPPENVVFSPHGQTLLACYRWEGIFSWDVAQLDQPPRVFRPFGDEKFDREMYLSVTVSAEGKQFVTSSDEKTFRLWEVGIDTPISEFPLQGGEANAAAFSSTANLVAYQDAEDQIYIWDVATGELRDSYKGDNDGEHYFPLAFCQNGTILASQLCYIYDVIQGKKVDGFSSDNFQFQAFSHDNNHIWVDKYPKVDTIELWHIQRYEKILSILKPNPILSNEEENDLGSFVVSDCGQYLACGLCTWPTSLEKARVHVYDIRNRRTPIVSFDIPETSVCPLAFLPDNMLLASISTESIYLWDLKPYL